MIEGDRPMAIKAYREALHVVEENEVKDGVRTDPLQKLHTLHNLAQALGYRPNPFSGTALLGGQSVSKAREKGLETGREEESEVRSGNGGVKGNNGGNKSGASGDKRKEKQLAIKTNEKEQQKMDEVAEMEADRKGKRKILEGAETEQLETGRKKQRVEIVDVDDEVQFEEGGTFQPPELPPEVPRTLRDDKLLAEAEEIRGRYVAAFQAKLAAAEKEYQKVHNEVGRLLPILDTGFSAGGKMNVCIVRVPFGVDWMLVDRKCLQA
jgi:hypothetical protein